jgi:hypothetical protein
MEDLVNSSRHLNDRTISMETIPQFRENPKNPNRIQIHKGEPIKTVNNGNHIIVGCHNITTEWNGSVSYSYLTNPESVVGSLYYILRNKDTNKFYLERNFTIGTLAMLTTELVNSFLKSLNNYKNLSEELETYRSTISCKRAACIIVAFLLISIIPGMIGLQVIDLINTPACVVISIICFILALLFIYLACVSYNWDKKAEAEFYTIKFSEYKSYIERWNIDSLNRLGVNATTVLNLNYVQLTLIDCVVLLEPHSKPNKKGKSVSKEKKLIDPHTNIIIQVNQPIVVIHQLVLSN